MKRAAIALAAAVACGACGLSQDVRQSATSAVALIDSANADIARREVAYRTFAASAAAAPYRVYAEREAWVKQFDYARVKTAAARNAYDRFVAPLLTRNRREDGQAVASQVAQINRLVSEAAAFARLPDRRRAYIDEIRANYKRLVRESAGGVDEMKAAAAPLMAAGVKAKAAFPSRAADIEKRLDPLQRTAASTDSANRKVAFEAANANAGRPADFVVLGDNAQLVSQNASRFREDVRTTTQQLGSLPKSYSKTLADMKAQYFITVERWSWNDSADNPAVHQYTYPRQEISGDAFDYFNSLPENLPYAARLTRSAFFGTKLETNDRVDRARWNALRIEPAQPWDYPRDDSAEYGYTLSGDYFHKYAITDGETVTETDWQKVDETMFEDHVDDLGMDIVSKPYGAFDDEKITNPTPAGLAFVGSPQYGTWQTDSRGESFWVWYGRYRLFSDLLGVGGQPYYYRRDEWNTWNARYRGQPYYGEDKDKRERYGTSGYVVGSSTRYATRIPEMRRIAVRHGETPVGRGGIRPAGK